MGNQLTTTNRNQQGLMSAPAASSQRLLECLIKLETPDRSDAKMELVLITNELMPQGKPQYLQVVKYPTIAAMAQTEGKKKMLAILVLLVKDFCGSFNVVRNMNEDQMIETAAMLLEECGNFRLEDYVMMFGMAKKGAFHPEVKIFDRLDQQVISSIMDEYWIRRHRAGKQAQEEEAERLENGMLENPQDRKSLVFDEKLGYVEQKPVPDVAGAIAELKAKMIDNGLDGKTDQ